MPNKVFDAVKTVRRIREAHHKDRSALSRAERLAYYRKKGREARIRLEALAEKLKSRTSDSDDH